MSLLDPILMAGDSDPYTDSECASDGDPYESDSPEEATSDEEEADGEGGDDAAHPKKARRAEINPEIMSDQERDALRARVVAQVEFYFGDAHYPNDKLMLQYAQADPKGFIDLSVIMGFKKMRRLTQFVDFVSQTLLQLSVVEVDVNGKRARRVAPIPKNMEEALTRTVLVEAMQPKHTQEYLLKTFNAFGPVEQIRILERSDPYPDDVNKYIMKGYRAKIPSGLYPNARPCALVEFASLEDALKCVSATPQNQDWRTALQISLLYKKSKAKKKASHKDERHESTSTSAKVEQTQTTLKVDIVAPNRANSFGGFPQGRRPSPAAAVMSRSPVSSPLAMPRLQPSPSITISPLVSPHSFDDRVRPRAADPRENSPSWRAIDGHSPQLQRRANESPTISPNIIRSPKIPDGSPGFSRGRGKPLSPATDH